MDTKKGFKVFYYYQFITFNKIDFQEIHFTFLQMG